MIEGPAPAIADLRRRLRADDRHLAVTVLVDRRVRARAFDGWSMANVEIPALDQFATLRDLAGMMRDLVADPELHDRIDCFVESFAIIPPALEWRAPADVKVS